MSNTRNANVNSKVLVFLSVFLIFSNIVEGTDLYVFYGEGCQHCEHALGELEKIENSDLDIVRKEVYYNVTNQVLFKRFTNHFDTPIRGVPTLFINDKVFVGYDDEVERSILREVELCRAEKCADLSLIGKQDVEINSSAGEANTTESSAIKNINSETVSIGKVLSLAAVDAINPCALAVLTMMLVAIIAYNPRKRLNILLAGAAFIFSVFVMYLFYGLVIIRFFQVVKAITSVRLILYKILGGAAVVLGLLQLKDFLSYKPGGVGTEMPLFMRPKVKKIISGITSPWGAFITGGFVTVFLLPCTLGPYIILGGILSFYDTMKMLPLLLVYNLIFVLPMIAITIMVYLGIRKTEDISKWKDRNIEMLHLAAGMIILLLGLGMLFGLF